MRVQSDVFATIVGHAVSPHKCSSTAWHVRLHCSVDHPVMVDSWLPARLCLRRCKACARGWSAGGLQRTVQATLCPTPSHSTSSRDGCRCMHAWAPHLYAATRPLAEGPSSTAQAFCASAATCCAGQRIGDDTQRVAAQPPPTQIIILFLQCWPLPPQWQLRLDRVSLVAALRGDWQSIPRHAWHVVQHRQACAQCPTVSHSVPLCHLPLLQWLQPWGDAPCRCAQHTGVAPALFVLVWGASSVTPRGQVWHELRSCWLWCTR